MPFFARRDLDRRAIFAQVTRKSHVERGGLPPLLFRELAPGWPAKNTRPCFTEMVGEPSQASLLQESGGKPPQSTWAWGKIHHCVTLSRCAPWRGAHLDCATARRRVKGFASWKDAVKIAQRFNAGLWSKRGLVPEGRQIPISFVPPGLECHCHPNPALKRWAIFKIPSGNQKQSALG